MVVSSEFIRLDNSFLTRLKSFKHTVDLEEIHRFRTDFKKLRVLYALIYSFFGNRSIALDDWRKRKRVFKCAGAIREAQIDKQLLQFYLPGENRLLSYFHNRLDVLLSNFSICISEFHLMPVHISTSRNIEEENLINGMIDQYYQKINFNIDVSDMENNQLHRIRSFTKALIYLQQLKGRLGESQLIDQKISEYKELENDIGEWHDRVVLLSTLNHLRKHFKLELFYPAIKNLRENLKTEIKLNKVELINRLSILQ